MSKFKSLSLIEQNIAPIIENLGYIFVDADLKKVSGRLTLTIYIDKPNGITLNDCELVSKAIDDKIDELDITNGQSFNLNVSSPGLDRPLLKEVDFKRNLNKEIEVKFFKPFNGNKKLVGVLTNYSQDDFEILVNNQTYKIDKKLVAIATPVIKF